MVRQYKIHTNLDGNDNKIFDMTSGKIRFYQPSDLGISATTNVWKSDGIGIFGDSQVNHPSLEFRLETFGDSLQENYQIFNEFVNCILSQKFVTLEYTSELGTFYADVKLANVSKTEAYGFNGTFSEKITFDTITAWYTYQALRFEKVENGTFNDNTKIHTHVYPNPNLLTGTKDFSGNFQSNWQDGGAYYYDDGYYNEFKVKSTTAQWYGLYQEYTITESGTYSFSAFVKSDYDENEIYRFVTINNVITNQFMIGNKFDWTHDSIVISDLSAGDVIHVRYEKGTYNNNPFSIAGYKLEYGSISTGDDGTGRYTYTDKSYVYSNEENIDRFSKWLIQENVFSFVARLTPSKNTDTKKFGLRFLDANSNEYSAIVFNLQTTPDFLQINTDTNDEYYQAIFNGQAVNMFSALDFQRFRTRFFEKGSMELIGLDSVEMNVKRKVDFV